MEKKIIVVPNVKYRVPPMVIFCPLDVCKTDKEQEPKIKQQPKKHRGAIGGETGKTAVLPGFAK